MPWKRMKVIQMARAHPGFGVWQVSFISEPLAFASILPAKQVEQKGSKTGE